MRVAYFPFKPGGNPYQSLFASALERAGIEVLRIPPAKLFPLQRATAQDSDILQLDWPHDWYRGRNRALQLAKRIMYEQGLYRLKARKVVWTAHNLIAHDAEDPAYEQRMIQKLVDVTDGIIVLSEASLALLHSTYKVREATTVEVIPHGHYMDVYENRTDRTSAREKLQLALSSKVALSLGRLLPYKGLEDLVQAFTDTAERDSVLLLAGSCNVPGYVNELEARVSAANQLLLSRNARIEVHARFIQDDEMQVYFNAADFVVLPFKNILNSGSLMLAMSFGKFVVAPKLGSIASVVSETGWLGYDAGRESGLAEALQTAMSLDDLADREERIIEHTIERYNWDAIGKKVRALYQSIS